MDTKSRSRGRECVPVSRVDHRPCDVMNVLRYLARDEYGGTRGNDIKVMENPDQVPSWMSRELSRRERSQDATNTFWWDELVCDGDGMKLGQSVDHE